MDAKMLSAVAGIVLSLAFSFGPGLKNWYEKLEGAKKSLLMAGLLLLVAGGSFGLSCIPSSPYHFFSCDIKGFWGLVDVFVAALVANQSTYLVTRKLAGKEY